VDLSAAPPTPAIRAVTRRRFEEVLNLVPLFRPRTVVAHAGYDWQRYDYFRKTWLENSVEFWGWVAESLNRIGSRLMLENVYEHHPGRCSKYSSACGCSNVGLCLDCGHLTAFGRAPLEQWLDELGALIGQIHLHDNWGHKDDHLPMGQGRIDFVRLFALLKSRAQPAPLS